MEFDGKLVSSTENKLICPHCGSVVAIAPDEAMPSGDLFCTSCGKAVKPPAGNSVADEAKSLLHSAERKIRDKLS